MRTSFSPTQEAARRLANRPPAPPAHPHLAPPVEPRWCEWPRRAPAPRKVIGIWQALQAIQTRHA